MRKLNPKGQGRRVLALTVSGKDNTVLGGTKRSITSSQSTGTLTAQSIGPQNCMEGAIQTYENHNNH